jgi:hypothetical protein
VKVVKIFRLANVIKLKTIGILEENKSEETSKSQQFAQAAG